MIWNCYFSFFLLQHYKLLKFPVFVIPICKKRFNFFYRLIVDDGVTGLVGAFLRVAVQPLKKGPAGPEWDVVLKIFEVDEENDWSQWIKYC